MRKTKKPQHLFQSTDRELELFYAMINGIADEVMVIDKTGRIVFVNDAVLKGTGYTRKYLLGLNVTKLRKEKISVAKWRKRNYDVVKAEKKSVKYKVQRVVKNGRIQTLEVIADYMKYGDQGYILAVSRDVSENINLQNKLVESERLYRMVCEQATDGICLVDLDGKVLYANKSSTKLFGQPLKKIIGADFGDFIEKNSLAKAEQCFYEVKRGNIMFCSEMNVGRRNKRPVPVEFTATPILKDKTIDRIHIIIRDVKQRLKIEALERESEKSKALQSFITGTAHEIHQPLRGLMSSSQAIIKKYSKRDFEYIGYKEYREIMKMLSIMAEQSRYCFQTVDRLIRLNKRKVNIINSCTVVPAVIKDTLKAIAHDLKVHDVKVKFRYAKNVPQVGIGYLELHQVMNNILINAVQSMPGGGNIDIKVGVLYKEKCVKIVCRDEGIGINKETLPKIFDPFFTTKKRGVEKSSGLGLSIVHSIVKSHKGQVSVQSSLRQGTTITILLPFCMKELQKA